MRPINTVMVLDDDVEVLNALGTIIRNEGASTILETDPRKALHTLRLRRVDALFTDLRMPGVHGFDVVKEATKILPGLPVIVVTGYACFQSAVEAMRLGAVDLLQKPFQASQVANALSLASIRNDQRAADSADSQSKRPPDRVEPLVEMVARSAAMKNVISAAKSVAAATVPIVLSGEVGVGKETVLQLMHRLSPQHGRPLVKVNCEATSETRLNEVVFGLEAGPDGEPVPGCLEKAGDGFLFLHRVASLPRWMQAELLQVAKERSFLRVGGRKIVEFNGRLAVTASEAADGTREVDSLLEQFRRFIEAAPIQLPPLRRRCEDIRPLIMHFMAKDDSRSLNAKWANGVQFSEEALVALEAYNWPGNLYELSNLVRRIVVFATSPHVSAERVAELLSPPTPARNDNMISVPFVGGLKAMERAIVSEVITRLQGNKAAAARSLGLHRKSLYRIMDGKAG